MTAVGIVVLAAGAALLWSGITGTSITDAVSDVLSGRKSAKPAAASPPGAMDRLAPFSPAQGLTVVTR